MVYLYMCLHFKVGKNDFGMQSVPDPILIYHPQLGKERLAMPAKLALCGTYKLYLMAQKFYMKFNLMVYCLVMEIKHDTGLPLN